MLGTLSDIEIKEVLQNNFIARIGCNDGSKTYVVPVSYVFMDNHVICHSFPGLKINMMRKNNDVCFEVDEVKDYSNWRSVIVQGRYEELTETEDIEKAKRYLSDEMLRIKVSQTALPPETRSERWHSELPHHKQSVFYRIRFMSLTGRFEHSML